ncbi:GNAT family N-acetyltransferase [Paenibacillus fonticola]|uniref:GNAT family N-acetyltransferase n=1 Tax=Paenibacillus fonticola TaxID=379896 RepID=UPI00035C48B9|nr:GNAT family N-acetyltransferase [Paenibacillus fonticola]
MAVNLKEGVSSRKFPKLESPRLVLRQVTFDDCESLFQCMTHPLVRSNTGLHPETLLFPERLFRYFNECYDNLRDLHFAVELTGPGSIIGLCSLQYWEQRTGKARLGYMISPSYWGRGYATEAAQLLIRYGFEALGLRRIEARCASTNPASERVLQKCGMSYVKANPAGLEHSGKNGRMKVYAADRQETTSKPVSVPVCYTNEILL